MYGTRGGGGLNLRSLLCFIPGIDQHKAWHPNGELRTLARTLSKDDIHTIRLGRKKTKFYGTPSSSDGESGDEDTDTRRRSIIDDSEDCSCPPAYLLLPPRTEPEGGDKIDGASSTRSPALPAPDIVILHPSDSDSLGGSMSARRPSSLIPDDSLDSISESGGTLSDSPTHSESVWISPLFDHHSLGSETTQRRASCSSWVTGSEPCTCSCSRSVVAGLSFSDSGSLTHSESCSTCVSSPSVYLEEIHSDMGMDERREILHNGSNRLVNGGENSPENEALKYLDNGSTTHSSEHYNHATEIPLFKRCTVNRTRKLALENNNHLTSAHIRNGENYEIRHVERSEPMTIVENCVTTYPVGSNATTDGDDLSSSTDSRPMSYVSRRPPVKTLQVEDDKCSNLSDITFWSTDSEADSDLAKLISREESAQTLTEVVECTPQAPVAKSRGLGGLVQTLLGRPSTKRPNPFNLQTADDNKKVSSNCD